MVEISMFGSGEGPVWVTGRGYSTSLDLARRTSKPWRAHGGYPSVRATPNPCRLRDSSRNH
jgi:hypothetical protein